MINSKYIYGTNTYGKNLISVSGIESWNNDENNLKTISFKTSGTPKNYVAPFLQVFEKLMSWNMLFFSCPLFGLITSNI